jgi:hypothetical protein
MADFAKVLTELQHERARLDHAIQAIERLVGRDDATIGGTGIRRTARNRPKRRLSAAARKKIAVAQRARWAKWKSNQGKNAA